MHLPVCLAITATTTAGFGFILLTLMDRSHGVVALFFSDCIAKLSAGSVIEPTGLLLLTMTAIVMSAMILGLFATISNTIHYLSLRAFLRKTSVRTQPYDGIEVFVFEDVAVSAFTFGLLRPAIFLSSSLNESFAHDELIAVLSHEAHHANELHPLKLFLWDVCARTVFFLPMVKEARDYHALSCEVRADRAAIAASSRCALARSMLRIANTIPGTNSVRAGFGMVPSRIAIFIEGKRLSLTFSLRGVCLSILALVGFTIALMPMRISHAHVLPATCEQQESEIIHQTNPYIQGSKPSAHEISTPQADTLPLVVYTQTHE